MKDYGLVSIIMPCYNSEKYIRESIQSVLDQTYGNWELLVVDDYSTDGSWQVVRSYEDKRIVALKNEKNSGAAISRNYALNVARGRWIAFLDSDDKWHPNKLEKQLSFMEVNGYSFTFTDYRVCKNGIWSPYIITGPNIVDKRKMYDYCYFSTITVVYDKNVVGLIQIEDLKKNNDYAMWLKAIEKTNAYRFPKCLSYYFKHDGSISSGSKIRLIKWHYLLFRKGQNLNVFVSLILTANNLLHGVWKKIYYKERL